MIESKLTNSELGSNHWVHTIINQHCCIGEFLEDAELNEELIRGWGKYLQTSSKELLKGLPYINIELNGNK